MTLKVTKRSLMSKVTQTSMKTPITWNCQKMPWPAWIGCRARTAAARNQLAAPIDLRPTRQCGQPTDVQSHLHHVTHLQHRPAFGRHHCGAAWQPWVCIVVPNFGYNHHGATLQLHEPKLQLWPSQRGLELRPPPSQMSRTIPFRDIRRSRRRRATRLPWLFCTPPSPKLDFLFCAKMPDFFEK